MQNSKSYLDFTTHNNYLFYLKLFVKQKKIINKYKMHILTVFESNRVLNRRMNTEVSKCADKREKLYSEYGAERFSDWRKEHSSVVLSPQEQVANLITQENNSRK